MADKRADPRFITSSQLVTSKATLVSSVLLSGSGNCSLMLADSATSNDISLSTDRKAVIYGLRDDSKVWSPTLPMQFDSGVYASLGGTGIAVTINVQEKS